MTPIHLGISTCPNDTFAFHGILEQRVDLRGLEFQTELLDVEELNQRLGAGDFDVAKASFHTAVLLSGDLGVLRTGSALGFGVGPLLLAARPGTHPRDSLRPDNDAHPALVLCPGEHTTATLLYKLFHPGEGELSQVVFSDIMPALKNGDADFGVCIHEGRFTWQQQGLALIEDLGTRWEEATSSPLPLGGILVRHGLGRELITTVRDVLTDSLAYAHAHRDETVTTMRRYAQELTEEVMFKHVDLYVNEWTSDLGELGRVSLGLLHRQAVDVGLCPPDTPALKLY
jgi:1,4-dihydroxy-6-naphthoate synthase